MSDLMPVNADDKVELFRIFREHIPGCNEQYEFDRFLSYLRGLDKQWEGNESNLKRQLLFNYLRDYIGPKMFRSGRD